MRLLSKEENPYEINVLDGEWLGNHSSDPKNAKRLIRGLLRRRFKNYEYKKFRNDRDLAQACVEFAKSCYFKFNGNHTDKQALESFKNLKIDAPLEVIESFRTLCRGYNEEDVRIEEKEVKKKKKHFLSLL